MGSPPPGAAPARDLALGFSPCPNDTFIFHGLVTGRTPAPGVHWRPLIDDVETLNRLALARRIPVTKVSFHAFGRLRSEYALLTSGAALGRGAGPLLVRRKGAAARSLAGSRIAVPGLWTSAVLLLRLREPGLAPGQLVEMPFDRILESVARGDSDAGVIIHESRFTYESHGLEAVADLGDWWEAESGLPVPLGGIIADRALGPELLGDIQRALRRSVAEARADPAAAWSYVKEHAQETADDVIRAHIDLYVNDFTEDLGEEGLRAVEALFDAAAARGVLPRHDGPLTI
jgi:1,4-dihydroxy-6-naphthoate synthase